METPSINFFTFFSPFPCLYYQSWNQHNNLLPSTSIIPSKQAETRESLVESQKEQNLQTERVNRNGASLKATKLQKSVKKQKLIMRRERDDNYQRKTQKKDRNLPSNIFKYLANFIYLNPNIHKYVNKCIPSHLDISPSKLIQKFKSIIKLKQSYIRLHIVQSLCRHGLLSVDEAKVFRIVLKKFLLVEMPVIVMSQPKLKRKQRCEYIKIGRKLFGQLSSGAFL